MQTRDVNPPFPAKPAFEGFVALIVVGATAHRVGSRGGRSPQAFQVFHAGAILTVDRDGTNRFISIP